LSNLKSNTINGLVIALLYLIIGGSSLVVVGVSTILYVVLG